MSPPVWVRALLRILSWLVPADDREDWRAEWWAEAAVLADRGRSARTTGPGLVGFVVGAIPHALWMRTEGWTMGGWAKDLAYAARTLSRAPGFTLVAGLTLALGLGANAAIFSLVNGLVLRAPGGVAEPDRLVQVARSYDSDPRWDNWSMPALRFIEREGDVFDGIAGYQTSAFVLGRGDETERAIGQYVTGSYFDVLGVRAHLGRLLGPQDDVAPGEHAVAVLGHGLWTRRFGADPGVVGSTLVVGSVPYRVVGVAAAGFGGADALGPAPQLWVPALQHPGFYGELPFEVWGSSWLDAVARLRDGVSVEQARAAMEGVSGGLRRADPVNEEIRVLVAQGVGLDPREREEARRLSTLLLGLVGLVLLLTCLNVANLFLARASTRSAEIGVRRALGAGRARVIRQWLTESLLIGVVAVVIAAPAVAVVGRFLPLVFPYTLAVPLDADGRVWAFLIGAGLVAGLLFGVLPAFAMSTGRVPGALRSSRHGSRTATRLRDGLVVTQIAISLGLVTGAALLGRSVRNARTADPGLDVEGLVVAFTDLDATGRYDEAGARIDVLARLVAELEATPGVRGVTFANQAPVVGGHSRRTVRPAERADVEFEAESIVIGPGYFETLGVPLVRGRPPGSGPESAREVVVNESLARLFWPEADAVGQQLDGEPRWRVVGVAADVQMRSLREAGRPAVYFPHGHMPEGRLALHVRGGPGGLPAPELRRAFGAVDPELPVSAVVSLREALAASMGETRTIGRLVAAFALLALVLAAVGLYGLMSYGVAQRRRELGIRLALGAPPAAVERLVLRRGSRLTAWGLLLGLAVALAMGRALRSLLFRLEPGDGLTLTAAVVVLAAVAGVAAWMPARRAARVDAVQSLRAESGSG